MPKASDFFLGVVDLFAIILPGAIMAFLLTRAFHLDVLLDINMKEAEGWVVLLIASYILGHIIFGLGAFFLGAVYDNTYKLSTRKERHCGHRIRAVSEAKKILKEDYLPTDNALEWASTFVRLGSDSASAEIDHLEADSKFFRSLTIVLLLAWPVIRYAMSPNLRDLVIAISIAVLPLLTLYSYISKFHPRSDALEREKHHLLAEHYSDDIRKRTSFELEANAEASANEILSRGCRRAAWAATLIWVALVGLTSECEGAIAAPPKPWLYASMGALYSATAVFAAWR